MTSQFVLAACMHYKLQLVQGAYLILETYLVQIIVFVKTRANHDKKVI